MEAGGKLQVVSNKKVVIEYTYKCDICGRESKSQKTCNICGRDICHSCIRTDPRDIGDYPARYCPDCFNIGKKYLAKIAAEEEKHEAVIEEIEKNWKDEALMLLHK